MGGTFDGRTVLITGGASGIGLACAQRFLEEGAQVAIADIDERALAEAEATLRPVGPVLAARCDVASVDDAQRVVDETVARFGQLDVLVANAGMPSRKRTLDLDEAEWDRVIDVNLKGMFTTVQAAGRHMRDRGDGGRIVMVASEMSFHADPEAVAYTASKGGVLMFMKAVALDLIRYDIHVNALCPGLVDTPLTEREIALSEDPERTRREWNDWAPIGRPSAAAEQAEGVLFLAGPGASYAVGTALLLDGGSIAR